jgi:tetratricopeptide (TPR) repeat protein
MMNRTLRTAVLALAASALWMTGCGPKPIQKESVLDTPDNHYAMGLRALDRGALDAAAEEFNRATALDPNYPGGYVGSALVCAEKKDFVKAFELVDKGIGKDPQFIDGPITKGRILAIQRKGDDWLENAVKQFNKALKLDPNSDKAFFFMGEAYKNAFAFGDAVQAFSKVIELKGDYAKRANSEWELVQKIQRAAPGTKVGKQIALIPEIDRADIAVLFIEELKLLEVLEKRQPKVYDTKFHPPADPTAYAAAKAADEGPATDIAGHWAKNYILDILKAGAMDVFPDHTFKPDEKITRANYAVFIQNILLVVTGDQSLASKYFGQDSRFPDVNSTNFAYNAICLAVDRGIMKTADPLSGAFGPRDPVSGADALLIIRDFQNALKMTF